MTGYDIRIIRKRHRLSETQLAELLEVSVMAVKRWEHNRVCPPGTYLQKLKSIFPDEDELKDVQVMYDAVELSRYIVGKCIKDEYPITNMQLQGILYCIQKDFLTRDELAFYNSIEAWEVGPVVPDVYRYYEGYKDAPIRRCVEEGANPADKKWIDRVVESKRVVGSWVLAAETLKTGGAWDVARRQGWHPVISIELLKEKG